MHFSSLKIDAQRILLRNRAKALAVLFWDGFLKFFFVCGFSVSLFTLLRLHTYSLFSAKVPARVGLYVFFCLALLFSYWGLCVTRFLRMQWFLKNVHHPQSFVAYFKRLSLRRTFKITMFYTVCFFRKLLYTISFLLPFCILSAAVFFTLKKEGLSLVLTACSAAFLLFLLGWGLYCACAFGMQTDAAKALLFMHPHMRCSALLKTGRQYTKDMGFSFWHFRLRFLLWDGSCLFFFPLFYVWPYRVQSLACLHSWLFSSASALKQTEKPIIFYCAKKPAGALV